MVRRPIPFPLAVNTLLAAIALLVPTAAPAAPEHPREIRAAEMVYRTEGWARTYRGLYWTVDGGEHWRDITPPVAHPASLGSVYFADPSRGWAIAEEGHEGANRDVLFGTSDGGLSWSRQRVEIDGLGTAAAGASFAMAGHDLVFALVQEARNTAFSIGFLLRSRDGGNHWEGLRRQPPQAGAIAFTDSLDGWLAGGGPHPGLYRTRDGGRSWTEVALPRPPGLVEARADYLAPRFEPDGHGTLGVTYVDRGGATVAALYTTVDDGDHWRLATELGPDASGITLLSYRGAEAAVGFEYPGPGLTLLTAGAAPAHLAGVGLAPAIFPSISFSGAEDGFALENGRRCQAVDRCTPVDGLSFTSDGGRTWAPTVHP